MEYNKKKIFSFIGNAIFWIGLMAATHVMVVRPLIETMDYKLDNVLKMMAEYPLASKGDQKSLERIEHLSYRDVALAYVMLGEFSRADELKAARIDMSDPNVTFASVDLSKSNALILRAVQGLSDAELLTALGYWNELFNDAERDRILSLADSASTETHRNYARYSAYSTLDQETKNQLNSCKMKLEEKFSNSLSYLVHLKSYGACTENPPDGLTLKAWKVTHAAYSIKQPDEKPE